MLHVSIPHPVLNAILHVVLLPIRSVSFLLTV